MLEQALALRASDVHLEPMAEGVEIRFRVDGVLQIMSSEPAAVGRAMITRLMVMGQLLTYRQDVPQEGRVSVALGGVPNEQNGAAKPQAAGRVHELRIAVMPTTHGLRAVVRMPAELIQPRSLEQLDLPPRVLDSLRDFVRSDAGMLILTGPAGSGKTTTIYALLEYIAQASPGVSIIALEDPVERDLPGVTQIEVSPFGQLTYERALRSILRQDPQVLMLGEIRDAATATLALQAAFSGHRLISTFHASTPAAAVARLLEMGLEPYQLTGALFGIMNQRLVRRQDDHGGYRGRVPVAQLVRIDEPIRRAILDRADADQLMRVMEKSGLAPLGEVARELVKRGVTDEDEVRRAGIVT